MQLFHTKSAESFGALFLLFLPSILQVSATGTCKTITQIGCSTHSFDIFCEALEKTGLDQKLDDLDTHFTVFLPTNAAFEHVMNDLKYNDIYECPKDTLRQLLLLHIRENQVIDKDGLQDRCTELMEMANGESTRTICENSASTIYQKGEGNSNADKPEIVSFDIEGCNGIVHIVNEVILPSSSCSAYPKCVALELEGECCPADDDKKLECCFDDHGTCETHPKCAALGLTGECCPTDDTAKLDCCFEKPPAGSCAAYPRCKELGLKGECCPTDGRMQLDCCHEEPGLPIFDDSYGYCSSTPDFRCYRFGRPECCLKSSIECPKIQPECEIGWPVVGDSYCTYAPDFGCYKNGRPKCCLDDSVACPEERPECEVGFPIIGESYCTFAPNYGCYKNGWPECCLETSSLECPKERPRCEIGFTPITDGSYCSDFPDYQCYEMGHPSCCFTKDTTGCPLVPPPCNVGARGCGKEDSLPSLYDFACSQRNFDILCHLLEQTELDGLFDNDGTLTLFAPSNRAFLNLGEETVKGLLENDSEQQLRDILLYHASNTIEFSCDLSCNRKLPTLAGTSSDDFTTTRCDDDGQLFQVGNGNGNNNWPWIAARDVVTCNGVVHIVNNVILPRE
eukprot:jgi/Psemu1/289641/fgenesh1_pg.382_\